LIQGDKRTNATGSMAKLDYLLMLTPDEIEVLITAI